MKYLCSILLLLTASCSLLTAQTRDFTHYVNPFIGTGGHGHTFPGAVMPFGMVQLSPDTRTDNWDGSSGYHYSDDIIYGFSHTHLSGTGIPDGCDILLRPTVGWRGAPPGASIRRNRAIPGHELVARGAASLPPPSATPRSPSR